MTTLERSVTTTDRTVGLFWDLESLQIPDGVDPVAFGSELFEIARTFSSMSNIDVARAFGSAELFTSEQKEGLWSIGFELVQTSDAEAKEAVDKALFMHILLWLWDTERQATSMRASPCVILVTSNHDFAPLLNKLRNRSAHVVLVTELTGVGRTPAKPEMRRAANVCIDWNEVVTLAEQAAPHQTRANPAAKSSENSQPKRPTSPVPTVALKAQHSTDSVRDYLGVAHDILGDDAGTPTATGPLQSSTPQQPSTPLFTPTSSAANDGAEQPPIALFGSVPAQAPTLSTSLGFGASLWRPQSSSLVQTSSSGLASTLSFPSADTPAMPHRPSSGYSRTRTRSSVSDEDANTAEHMQLAEDMITSFNTQNVKVAVSTLRKIYTKQTRTFRITSLLSQIIVPLGYVASSPTSLLEHVDGSPDEVSSLAGSSKDAANQLTPEAMNSPEWIEMCKFSLTCIQWCFGVQKGSKVESFKYKMNKNIARWILKELQRKGIPENDDLKEQAINVTNEVLQHVVELDFCLEMLESMGVENPLQVLRPHVASWINSDHPTLSARAADFAHRYSLSASLIQERQEYDLNEALAASTDPRNNAVVHRAMRQVLLKRWTSRELPPENLTLEDRLIYLLAKNSQGVMGARIPALYRDEYGEPMRLGARRKLKDVLLATGKVQMIGPEGPGDKLFRLRPRAKAEMEAKYDLGYEHAEPQEEDPTEGNEEEDFFFMSPLRPPAPTHAPAPPAIDALGTSSLSRNLYSSLSSEASEGTGPELLPLPPPGFNPIITRPRARAQVSLRPQSAPQNPLDMPGAAAAAPSPPTRPDPALTRHYQHRSWDANYAKAALGQLSQFNSSGSESSPQFPPIPTPNQSTSEQSPQQSQQQYQQQYQQQDRQQLPTQPFGALQNRQQNQNATFTPHSSPTKSPQKKPVGPNMGNEFSILQS